MTREERQSRLNAYITCLKCEVSSKCCDDNCPIQYEAGNMGEIIENLEAISNVLEQEPKAAIALERYKDLQDYFGDEDIAKTVLENQTEFKAWLERLRWNTKKVDELARKLEELQKHPCEDAVSRNLITQTLNKMDRYVAEELTLCDTERKFPKNEVFIVDDVYEKIVEQLPSVNSQQPCEDCISRQALIECINHEEENFKSDHMESISSGEGDPFVDGVLSGVFVIRQMVTQMPPVKPCEDMGEVSDGYHTFNQLYHQRAVLFATIVNQNKDKSWKSFKHSDGNYCFDSNGEWFIVGIDTPQGSYTYHYAKEYWDMFDCEELECGKEWDGHTEEDVTRLLSLQNEPCEDCISRQAVSDLMRSLTRWCIRSEDGKFNNAGLLYDDVMFGIDKLLSVKPQEPKTRWIPCSERLPSDRERKEWIDKNLDGIGYLYPCLVTRYSSIDPERTKNNPYVAKHYFDGEDFVNNGEEACSEYITAWMPLPEPYKTESEE